MIKKHPKADLRSSHTILLQIGIICSLLFFIAATNLEIKNDSADDLVVSKTIDPVTLTILPPSIPPEKPAPHKPSVLNPVPDDSIIDPEPLTFEEFYINSKVFKLPPSSLLEKNEILDFVEIMPDMIGGVSKLYAEIDYPKQARIIGVEGKVIVQYIVNEKGEVENPEIIRAIGGGCDEEVLRAIKLMSFTPGIQNGRFVKVKLSQMVTFKLQN